MWANKYSSAPAEIFMGKQLETPEAAEDTLNHNLQETGEGKYGLNVKSPKREVKFCSIYMRERAGGRGTDIVLKLPGGVNQYQ